MKKETVKPFVDATRKVLQTMAFIVPRVGEPCTWSRDASIGDIVGIVGLSNEDSTIQGFMSIGFSEPSILQIVSSMLGEECTVISEDVRDAVGEISNMISGQARQSLSSQGIRLQASLPSIVSGHELFMEGTRKEPLYMVRFEVEKGCFEVAVCIEGLS